MNSAATEHESIAERLTSLRTRIDAATQQYQRPPQSVTLLAASKTRPAATLRVAYELGLRDFGENYLQEALDKQVHLTDLHELCWHFIGPIQSNKTRAIANAFDWVQSVDREKIARRLSAQRDSQRPPLNICIQVNLGKEAQKAGTAIDDLETLAALCLSLPQLRLRGLMAIPPKANDPAQYFKRLGELLATLNQQLPQARLDTLSMGMSADLEAAIGSGSTMLRIGSALFGSRAG